MSPTVAFGSLGPSSCIPAYPVVRSLAPTALPNSLPSWGPCSLSFTDFLLSQHPRIALWGSRGWLEITHIEGQTSWATQAYELTSAVARRSIIPNRPWL